MPRTSFLFWNIDRKPLTRLIGEIARTYQVDVLILAECEIDPAEVLRELNSANADYDLPDAAPSEFLILTRFPGEMLVRTFESRRLVIRTVKLLARQEVLVAAVHLPDRRNWSSDDIRTECARLADRIREVERSAGHARTVLVGDFNANPFEPGMVAADGFHAVMTRHIAAGGSRKVQGVDYPYFYNPIWSRLGDLSEGPAGTYYYNRGNPVTYFWNMLDQVLVRPELAERMTANDVRVLSSTGETSLVSARGRPNEKAASDHLPLVFQVEF